MSPKYDEHRMGPKAQAIMGAFAQVAGDLTDDWMVRTILEQFPEYASAQSIGLIASERQLDGGPQETTAQLASRTTQAAILWKYAGTPLGMLLALHYAGFDNAVIVQQNGLAFQLQLPLPAIPLISGQAWQPQTSLIVTQCDTLATALTSSVTPSRSIPAGTPWFMFDSNTDFCSRFAILFPGPLPSYFMTVGRATFSNTDSAPVVWNNVFPDTTYVVSPGPPVVTDGGGPVTVFADNTTKTTTGITIRASAAFTGYVDVHAWQAGANPFADLHPIDLQRLKNIIAKWKPKKASCVGAYAISSGRVLGWPVRNIGGGDGNLGPANVVIFAQGV
jgi:hypothetical protein